MEPEMFIDNPILFGDFLKMGADKADKMYEELNDFAKLKTILNDVSVSTFADGFYSAAIKFNELKQLLPPRFPALNWSY